MALSSDFVTSGRDHGGKSLYAINVHILSRRDAASDSNDDLDFINFTNLLVEYFSFLLKRCLDDDGRFPRPSSGMVLVDLGMAGWRRGMSGWLERGERGWICDCLLIN